MRGNQVYVFSPVFADVYGGPACSKAESLATWAEKILLQAASLCFQDLGDCQNYGPYYNTGP